MKGFISLALGAFLIILVLMVVLRIAFWGQESLNERVMPLKSDVYFVRNALDIARSYFLPECFRMSLYQSMHNNSVRGGWLEIPEGRALCYEEKTYALWSSNGRDLYPGLKDFGDALWQSFIMNLGQSLRKGEATVLVKVVLPEYRAEDISVYKVNDLKVHVEAKASRPLTASKRSGEDLIEFSKSADVSRDFDSPYFLLYEKARAYHSEILPKMQACSSAEIDKSVVSAFYTAGAAVVQDYGSHGRCLVRVEVATTQKYLISDDRTLLYQPIKLTFFESMGDDYRKCLDCRAQGKDWCIEGKACEDAGGGGAPCAGKPAITASCDALSRTSCADCMSTAPEGEHWVWCKAEGVCAQSCPGESVSEPAGCQAPVIVEHSFQDGDRIWDFVSGDMLFEYHSSSGMWSSWEGEQFDTEYMLGYIDYYLGGFLFTRADWSAWEYMSSGELMSDLENGFAEEEGGAQSCRVL